MEVLAEIGSLPLSKPGRVVCVRVCDADRGGGPAVDVRERIDDSAYDRLRAARARAALNGRRWNGPHTDAELFTGFTRKGFWLQPSAAESLAELLAKAALTAENLECDEEFAQ
jgi:hypothetical protein